MKSLRTAAVTVAILLATAVPSFASLGGTDPRPPSTNAAVVVAQTLLALAGL